jgi:predicted nucleic acid-binding protein
VIVDTSIWIDLEQSRLSPADLAAIVGADQVYLTPPTIAELRYGVKRATSEARRTKRAAALAAMEAKPCLHIDRKTGEILGDIAAQVDAAGRPSQHRIQDLWIASLALQHGMRLLTQNRSDFDDIPGLNILSLPPRPPKPSQAGSPP